MRQLFVPACISLIALTASADSKLSPRHFTGAAKAAKKIVARVPSEDGVIDGLPPQNEALPAKHDLTRAHDEFPHGEIRRIAVIDLPPRSGAVDVLPPSGVIDIPQQPELSDEAVLALLPPPPKPVPVIVKSVVPRSRSEVCNTLTRAAQNNDLPVPFFIRLLFQESHFKAGVVSPAGAQGIAQFMPETAADVGLDNPFDPLQAIPASARLLGDLLEQFGNLGLAAAAYNAGAKRIQDWLAKKGKLPKETQGYVKTVTGRPVETWTVAAAGVPAMKLPRRAPCQDAAGLSAWNGPDTIPTPTPAPRARMAAESETPDKHPATRGAKVAVEQLAARKQKSTKKSVHAHAHKHNEKHNDKQDHKRGHEQVATE